MYISSLTYGNLYRVYKKKCPKWKIASTSDIPQNLGYFLQPGIIRSLLVYLGQKIFLPTKFMLPGGASCRLILKWHAHKNVNLKMGSFSIGYMYEGFLINCQSFRKNGAY